MIKQANMQTIKAKYISQQSRTSMESVGLSTQHIQPLSLSLIALTTFIMKISIPKVCRKKLPEEVVVALYYILLLLPRLPCYFPKDGIFRAELPCSINEGHMKKLRKIS